MGRVVPGDVGDGAASCSVSVALSGLEGVSGTKELEDREGLSELLTRIRANGVRVVIVARADRIARDLLVSEVILGQFRDLSVSVIAADGGTDLTAGDEDPTRVLIRQVLGAVAQFETERDCQQAQGGTRPQATRRGAL